MSNDNSRTGYATSGRRRRIARRTTAAAAAMVLAALGVAPAVAQQPTTRQSAAQQPTGLQAAAQQPARTPDLRTAHGRGTLLSITPVADLDRADVARFLASGGMDTATVRHGLRGYRLTYRTVTPQGAPTTATGLLALPKGGPHRLDLVSDTHGTMAHRGYAPSAGEDFGRFAPTSMPRPSRAVAAPDYLGLGKGPGRHPYMDTKSSVTASLDMLRAARTAAQRLGLPLTGDVYASGFSQGGQVAMALGKALGDGADRHFELRALAPVSGPYDIEHAETPALFDGRVNDISAVFYMSYYLTAQSRLHPLYKDPPRRSGSRTRTSSTASSTANTPRRRSSRRCPRRSRSCSPTTTTADSSTSAAVCWTRRAPRTATAPGNRTFRYGCTPRPVTPTSRSPTPVTAPPIWPPGESTPLSSTRGLPTTTRRT